MTIEERAKEILIGLGYSGMEEEEDNFITKEDRTTWGSVMADIKCAYMKGYTDAIDKACAWLKSELATAEWTDILVRFRQAMEEEL